MITIGLTGWGDHDSLYPDTASQRNKLHVYSSHFLVVEIDSSFYAIQPQRNYQKWVQETPDSFQFVVKAYQEITGHLREKSRFSSSDEIFEAFKQSFQALVDAGKLKAVLCQFPPWFECNKQNVDRIRMVKEKLAGYPVALEFRHQSWFTPAFRDKTLQFMQEEGWIHSICDEPQAGSGSIPTVLQPTDKELTIVRFHGRNVHGWNSSGQANWRDVRYLYRYNREELLEWKEMLLDLEQQSNEIVVLFNNNSGGDAAHNAKELIDLMGIEYQGLSPRQMELF